MADYLEICRFTLRQLISERKIFSLKNELLNSIKQYWYDWGGYFIRGGTRKKWVQKYTLVISVTVTRKKNYFSESTNSKYISSMSPNFKPNWQLIYFNACGCSLCRPYAVTSIVQIFLIKDYHTCVKEIKTIYGLVLKQKKVCRESWLNRTSWHGNIWDFPIFEIKWNLQNIINAFDDFDSFLRKF